MSFRLALTALLLACAGLAAAQPAAPAADASAPAASNAATPVVIEASAPVAAAAPPQQRCHKETRTGTTIPRTVCEPVQTEAERQHTMDSLENQIRVNNAQQISTTVHN
jgi:hypothetical protein